MNNFIAAKTQEIAYVILRLSAYIRRFDLKKRLENLAYHLIENVSYENHELTLGTINAIYGFVDLAKNVYEIEPINSKLLTQELEILERSVREKYGMDNLPDIKSLMKVKQLPDKMPDLKKINNSNLAKNYPKPENKESSGKGLNRQDSIISLIRQSESGKIQLKDVIAAFPDLSERTIRYDLQKLCEEGVLSREGSGGPSNFYKIAGISDSTNEAKTAELPSVINLP